MTEADDVPALERATIIEVTPGTLEEVTAAPVRSGTRREQKADKRVPPGSVIADNEERPSRNHRNIACPSDANRMEVPPEVAT